MKLNQLFTFLSICALLFSCKEKNDTPPFLTIETKTVNFSVTASTRDIPVKTSIENWTASVQDDAKAWLSVRNSQTSITISVNENKQSEPRKGEIKIVAGTLSETIVIEQSGTAPHIAISPDSLYIEARGATREVKITSNVEKVIFSIEPTDATWLSSTQKEEAPGTYSIVVEESKMLSERSAKIIFKSANPAHEATARDTLLVTQKKLTGTAGDVEVPKDIKVKPTGGKANQFQPGQGIENTIDGVFGGAPYHSPWGSGTTMPVILEYFFDDKPEQIDYLIYHTRSGNGNFGKLKLYVATEQQPEYTLYGDYDFRETSSPSRVIFNNGLKSPVKIKFEILSGASGYASCDEMEFFRVNKENAISAQLLTVFDDISCSALKAGVTDEQINAIPVFFANIATSIKEGTYPRDFRIAQYKAYSIAEEWSDKLITKKRGVLDNCTGIYGETNEEIIVLVGKTNGNLMQLRCIEDANYNGDNYMLNEGINKITLRNRGLLYVMYNVSDINSSSAKPVTVHFPMQCGKVNGYWDINTHETDEKYKELLAQATYPYFDIKGNHMMLKFSTDNGFRKYIPNNIVATIQFWDEMVQWQQSIMGLEGIYPEKMNNRMYARSTPDGYMSAQDYQTNFAESALNKILNPTLMLQNEDDPWGPSHEIGHMNQGAINWAGTTETSNNLFANLVHHKMTSFLTRGESIEQNVQALLIEKKAYTHEHASMRMNWQLYSYFHWLKNDEQFFPKLFKISRENGRRPIERNPGWSQLNFVRNACDAARLDLSEYFDFWGFFRPKNINFNQYGNAQLLVTQEMVDETRQYVRSKNYPKPKYPIQYIEDRDGDNFGNVGKITQFKQQQKITKNITYTKNGNTITVNNGDEAIGFEVKDGDEVKFFSNKFTFTLPTNLWTDNAKIYAVQTDGARILLNP